MSQIAITFETANDRTVEVLLYASFQRGQVFYQMIGVEIDGEYTSAEQMSSYTFFRFDRWAANMGIEEMVRESLSDIAWSL